MAYPSGALLAFRESIGSANRLSSIEGRYADPPKPDKAPTVQALRGGFCVLIVGAFERFLVEAFEEHLGRLEGEPPPVSFSGLPEGLRVNSLFESLDLAMKGPRYGSPGKRSNRVPGVIAAAGKVVSGSIDAAALAQTKGNPESKRVGEMFKAIGVPQVFTDTRSAFNAKWAKPESSSFVEDKLDEIVRTRHVVAHTAEALQIGRSDLSLWSRFLEALADVLDERLDAYAENVLKQIRPV